MTRRSGQITGVQVLLGACVTVGMVVGMVRLMGFLLPEQDPEAVRLAQQIAERAQSAALRQSVPGVRICPAAENAPRSVSSALLYECPRLYDQRVVTYTGEVVGEVLLRQGHAWVQLNDDAYALTLGPIGSHAVSAGSNSGVSVSIPLEAAEAIENVGASERLGDRLTVRGVFYAGDPADGGGTGIRADEVLAVERGGPRPGLRYPGRRLAAAVLLPVTLIVAGIAFREQLLSLPWLRRRRARAVR